MGKGGREGGKATARSAGGAGGQGQGGERQPDLQAHRTGRCADVERSLDFLEGLILQGMDAGGLSIGVPDGAA